VAPLITNLDVRWRLSGQLYAPAPPTWKGILVPTEQEAESLQIQYGPFLARDKIYCP